MTKQLVTKERLAYRPTPALKATRTPDRYRTFKDGDPIRAAKAMAHQLRHGMVIGGVSLNRREILALQASGAARVFGESWETIRTALKPSKIPDDACRWCIASYTATRFERKPLRFDTPTLELLGEPCSKCAQQVFGTSWDQISRALKLTQWSIPEGKCRWCFADAYARVKEQEPIRFTPENKVLLGRPCKQCTERLMANTRKRKNRSDAIVASAANYKNLVASGTVTKRDRKGRPWRVHTLERAGGRWVDVCSPKSSGCRSTTASGEPARSAGTRGYHDWVSRQ